jgi:hypothetical protein
MGKKVASSDPDRSENLFTFKLILRNVTKLQNEFTLNTDFQCNMAITVLIVVEESERSRN